MRITCSEVNKPGFEFPHEKVEGIWLASAFIEGDEWCINAKQGFRIAEWQFAIAEDYETQEDFYHPVWRIGDEQSCCCMEGDYGYHGGLEYLEKDSDEFVYAVSGSRTVALLMLIEGMAAESTEESKAMLENQYKNIPW